MADLPPGLRGAEALGDSLNMWRALGEAVPDVLLLVSRDGTILYVNRAPDGVVIEDMLSSSVFELALTENRAELRAALEETFDTGELRVRTIAVRHPRGDVHWYATHTGPLRAGDRIVAAAIVARDVTDRKRVEDALRESEERYRTVVEHAPEAIVVFDVDAECFVDANRNACALFGLSRAELLQTNPIALSPPAQPDGTPSAVAALRYIGEALEGGTPMFDWTHRTPCDLDLRCQIRLVRLPSEGRRLVRGSITDVTRQRQLEEHVQQLQKVEALGQLAGGVAHDFNNILTVIANATELLSHQLSALHISDPHCTTEIEEIRSAARRGSSFTSQLLAFARQRQPVLERLDLNVIVEDVSGMVRRLMARDIRLITRLDQMGAFVRGHRSRLEQVLMNLLLNARDAMPGGGSITISTANIRGRSVVLRVQDTGTGMDDATRRRVFEPLFTTKAPGKGTGLGLSTLHAIVTHLGGHVDVASELGRGTTFEVTLPAAP